METKRCPIYHESPKVDYDPFNKMWKVGCSCTNVVNPCDKGHKTYEEAVQCWNNIVSTFKVSQ